MNAELRERLGKAAFAGRARFYHEVIGMEHFDEPPWEQQGDEIRELYKIMGEDTVFAFGELFIPVIQQLLSADEVKQLLASLG